MKHPKKRILSLLLAAGMSAALLTSCSSGGDSGSGDSGSGETYNFSFTIHDPAASSKTMKYEELAAATKDATNGAVNITVYPGGTLVASTDVAEGVLTGTATMGWLFTTFFPGQFPLTEVISLPMTFDDNVVATKTLLNLYEQSPDLQNELAKYKVFNLYCNPINYIYSNKAVNTVDDMKGQQLRAPSGVPTEIVTAWGGTPILQGPGDVYQSVEKGVLDGCIFEWSGFDDFKLYEVIKYCTEVPVYTGPFLTVMNLDAFNSLPEEYQAIMDEIWGAQEVSVEFAELFEADVQPAADNAVSAGMEIITPDETAMAGFQEAANAYIDSWVDKNTTDSFDAQAYLDLMMQIKADVEAEG